MGSSDILHMLYSVARDFLSHCRALACVPTVLCKRKRGKKREKFIALVLLSISTVALLKTLSLSDESECYLPLEEALCLSRKKLNFQGCNLEGFSLRKLARILSLLSSEGSSIPGSVTLTVPCTVNVYLGENRIS